MSSELLESIKRQAEGLTPHEKSRLATYLLDQVSRDPTEQTAVVDEETTDLKRKQHMEWLKAHDQEFGGQYVALDGGRLVCTGRTFREVSERARSAGKSDAFVTYLPRPGEAIEGGAWL